MTHATSSGELIVVSGASTGIGAATARELASRGFHVLAGVRSDRDGDAIRGDRIEPIMLDITVGEHIRALAARVGGNPPRAVINNAGIEINAPVEVLPLDLWRAQFEVNLFGHIAVTQALLPACGAAGAGWSTSVRSVRRRCSRSTARTPAARPRSSPPATHCAGRWPRRASRS